MNILKLTMHSYLSNSDSGKIYPLPINCSESLSALKKVLVTSRKPGLSSWTFRKPSTGCKLINYNTPSYLIKIFTSYLRNRKFTVRVDKELSNLKDINAGVAQGSNCGPVLSALFINDIPKQHNTMLSIFADDTAMLVRNKNHNYIRIALNKHLKTLEDWFLKWNRSYFIF
ncbi:hypothetical protein AVEN_259025-1 [Araneus ventricosus]|uniref:Reverse transcriptase domain-containing protein n=1 Tax=Araneus ventricosus TaxID=182803 RepID=A0A4Y2TIH0_ARAVE|nr:hypothetical protein AVEN_259025-1 [Araneus ventricosus]